MSITMSADAHTQLTNQINALGQEVRQLKKQNKELTEQLEDDTRQVHKLFAENKELKEEIEKLKKESEEINHKGWKDIAMREEEFKKLKEKVKYEEEMSDYMEKVSDAKSDIILNMFSFITEDLEEVQYGFTFKRDWGRKYDDEWNKIVTDELKDAVKEINEDLDDDEMEWNTDGYRFLLQIKDGVLSSDTESASEEEEEEVESKVDMEAFKKLKGDGKMAWVK